MVNIETMQRLTDAQRDLVEKNLGLVYKIVHRLGDTRTDDLIQVGVLGLCHAVVRWNPEKAKLSTYAYRWILEFVLGWRRRYCGPVTVPESASEERRRAVELTCSLSGMEQLPRQLICDCRRPEQNETVAFVRQVASKLTGRDRQVFELVFLEEKSVTEAALLLGVVKQRVSQVAKRAMTRFRVLVGREILRRRKRACAARKLVIN